MKHGGLSKEKANELSTALRDIKFVVGNRLVRTDLSWDIDRFTNALKIRDRLPGSWKSGAAAVARWRLVTLLQHYGFEVSRFPRGAFTRTETEGNGPHIYFWGPGTPPPDERYRDKVMHGKKLT